MMQESSHLVCIIKSLFLNSVNNLSYGEPASVYMFVNFMLLIPPLVLLYMQILSRNPHLDEDIYNQLVQKAVEEGYDVSKLHKTPQSDQPPEADQGPKDTKGIWWVKSLLGW